MKRARPYLAFAVLFLLTRVFLLVYSEYLYDEEEYKTGSIAALVMDGPKLPLLEYQPGDYEGGTLLFGLLTIPFFLVFGKTFIALKALALTTALLLALSQALWAKKIAGARAGWIAGALALIPIPYLTQIMSLPWGNYAETAALTAFCFLLFHIFLFEKRASPALAAVLGFLWGLGTWMHYGFLVTPLVCLLLWFLTDKGFFKSRRLYLGLVFALIGFSPWIVYNLTHHFWGIVRFFDAAHLEAGASRLAAAFSRITSLLFNDLAAGMHFRFGSAPLDRLASYSYELLLVGAITVTVLAHRHRLKDWLFALAPGAKRRVAPDAELARFVPLLYAVAFAAAYCLSGYGLFDATWSGLDPETHAHIFQLYPALSMVAALAVDGVWKRRKTVARVALGVFLVLGLLGNAALLDLRRPQTERLLARAYDRDVIYMEIGSKWARAPAELGGLIESVPDHAKRSMSFGAGITYGLFHTTSIQVAVDKCAALPERFWPYCHLGVGCGLASSGLDDGGLEAATQSAPETFREIIETGTAIGHIWFGRPHHPAVERARRASKPRLPAPEEQDFFRQFLAGHLAMAGARPKKGP